MHSDCSIVSPGIGSVGMYAGLSYFLGAEIACAVGKAGARVVLDVIRFVLLGLGIKAALSR